MYKRAIQLQLLATAPDLAKQSYQWLLQEFQCFCRILPPLVLREAASQLPPADLYIALDREVLVCLPPLQQPLRDWSDMPEASPEASPEAERQAWLAAKLRGVIGGLRLLHRLKNEENQ